MSDGGMAPVDGGELFFEVTGDGLPVVLIHAGLWDSRMWDDQVPAFSKSYRVVRYDVRGYGRSSRPAAPYSHADDLRAVMDFLGIGRAALVGLSMGGGIAIDFTLAYPAMVSALALAGTGVEGYDFSDDMERAYEPAVKALEAGDARAAAELELAIWAPMPMDDERSRRIRDIAMENAHQIELDDALRIRSSPPAIERLSEIAVPTLVLIGDRDVPDMLAIADLLEARIRGARRELINDADHVPNMRRPDEFNRLTLAFLDAVLTR